MKYKKLIYCVFGIMLFAGWSGLVWGQDRATSRPKSPISELNDDNFKKKIAKGFVLIKFTAPYQYATLDGKLFDGVKGFEGCVIM